MIVIYLLGRKRFYTENDNVELIFMATLLTLRFAARDLETPAGRLIRPNVECVVPAALFFLKQA